MAAPKEVEIGNRLMPKFNADGIIPVVTMDSTSKEILMVAYMNDEALRLTISTGKATYYSRSRNKLWVKGETSGFLQLVEEIRVDCDQDCLILMVKVTGGAACHVGYRSCFYRRIKPGTTDELEFVENTKVFDPNLVYGKTTS